MTPSPASEATTTWYSWGDPGPETVTIAPNGGQVRLTRDVENVTLVIVGVERILVLALDGDDKVTGTDGLAATGLRSLRLEGGDGNDNLKAGDTNDELIGGADSDLLHGGAGDDLLFASPGNTDTLEGGLGNDQMFWVPGDGNVAFIGGDAPGANAKAWTAPHVPLAAGTNVLTATVRDTVGNEVSDTLEVNAFTYTLAEGSTGSFFDTDILIANPNNEAAPVTITYLKGVARRCRRR